MASKKLELISVRLDEKTMSFYREVAAATGTKPDDVASILVYLAFSRHLMEEAKAPRKRAKK